MNKLGNSGVLVSEMCLGTMTFGWQADEATSHRILDRFTEDGNNFIDTANVYAGGKSEEIIGSWLKAREREDVVIATKARFRTGDSANRVGLSRKHLLHAVNESLKRLNTDYIDLFQVHAYDPLTPLDETFGTLSRMVDEGLIRYVGISNYRGWQFEKALQLCRSKGWHEPVSVQPHYNIIERATEFEIIPMAREENIAVIPWSPLAGGVLTGKYRDGISKAQKGTRIADSNRADLYSRYDNERTERIISAVAEISRETGKSMAQVSINWLLSNPVVTAPIIGARNLEQLNDNLGGKGWSLTGKQVQKINDASSLETTYPYDDFSQMQQDRDRTLS